MGNYLANLTKFSYTAKREGILYNTLGRMVNYGGPRSWELWSQKH